MQEPITFTYPDRGAAWIDGGVPLDAPEAVGSVVAAGASASRFTEAGGVGVVTRFGVLYGPGSEQSELQARLARRHGGLPMGRPGDYVSSLHLADRVPWPRSEPPTARTGSMADRRLAPAATSGAVREAPAADRVGLAVRLALVGYAAALAVTGAWAAGFPRSFYDDFPGLGRVWVAVDGPYNQHLVRDVGTLNLALATLLAVAAVRATPLLITVAAGVSLVNAVPHLTYHLVNLDAYDTADQVANAAVLGASVAVPLAVLWWVARTPRPVDAAETAA